jgi:predicted peroxiredoxin
MKHVTMHSRAILGDGEGATLAVLDTVGDGRDETLLLTMDGVQVAARNYADGRPSDWLRPLSEIVQAYAASGGRILVCAACAHRHGLTPDDLIDGISLIPADVIDRLPVNPLVEYRPRPATAAGAAAGAAPTVFSQN